MYTSRLVINVTQNSVSVNKSDETKQMKNLGLNDGCKMEVKDIELVETFKCTGQELYNALTQKEMMQVFTGGEVKVNYIFYKYQYNCKWSITRGKLLKSPDHYFY